nr:uncharacterized protein LOC129270369 [Lytechinus pictus]
MATFLEELSDDEPNPFSFKNFSTRQSQHLPEAPVPAQESSSDDSESESPTEDHGKDGKNPFSFKTFIKKEKRKAVYYSSREQLDSSGMEEEDWVNNMFSRIHISIKISRMWGLMSGHFVLMRR